MTKNHVALRAIASHLDVLREKLLKNGANIKENRLILSCKNGQKEIKY